MVCPFVFPPSAQTSGPPPGQVSVLLRKPSGAFGIGNMGYQTPDLGDHPFSSRLFFHHLPALLRCHSVQDRSTSESQYWACMTPETATSRDNCYIVYGLTDDDDEYRVISHVLVGEICLSSERCGIRLGLRGARSSRRNLGLRNEHAGTHFMGGYVSIGLHQVQGKPSSPI